MGEDGVKPCQVVDSVKATLVTVETLQPHLVANDRQKVVGRQSSVISPPFSSGNQRQLVISHWLLLLVLQTKD